MFPDCAVATSVADFAALVYNYVKIYHYTGTVICASKVRWRDANAYIGPQEVYKAT